MKAQLEDFQTEIAEIVGFAKRINYNIENGIDELMKLWIQDGLKFQSFVNENKSDFVSVVKQFTN